MIVGEKIGDGKIEKRRGLGMEGKKNKKTKQQKAKETITRLLVLIHRNMI